MRTTITTLLWTLSILHSLGDVAVIHTTTAAIQRLSAKAYPTTDTEIDPFLLLAGPKPPMIANPIPSLIAGAAHDIKPWLKANGVEMEAKDLALSFWDKDLVVVRSSPETIHSIRMLVETETNLYPKLKVILRVRERIDASSKDICRLETITRSGYKLPVGDAIYDAHIEPTLSTAGDFVDSMIHFTGKEELAGKSITTFFVAKPGEEVDVATWTLHEKSITLSLEIQAIPYDKPGLSATQLLELTQEATKVLDEEEDSQAESDPSD